MAETTKAEASAWKVGLLVAAVVTVIAVGVMAVVKTPRDDKGDLAKAKKAKQSEKKGKKDRDEALKRPSDVLSKKTYIAQLTRVVDCEWAEEASIAQGSHLKEGQEVDLKSGLAELTFHSGAQVILEGPAKFKVVSRTSGDLTVGKMTADVPDNVQKFTINTPVVKIVDAEFHGGVETEGTPEPGKKKRIRLGEGESIRID